MAGATTRVVDLTGVKEGGNFRPRRKPEGDYRAKIVKVADHQPKDKNKPMGWVYTVQVEGDGRSTYPYYVNPSPKEAWKIRQIAEAAGFKLNPKKIKFDPNKLVNKLIGIALVDDEYEGRVKSSIDDVFPVSEVGANADEDAPDDDEVDVDDVEEDDEVDTATDVEDDEEEEEVPAPKSKRKRKPAPEPEPEEDEDEEEEEDEPAPAPRKKSAAKKTAPAKKAKKASPPPDDEDDDDDLDIDDLDDE